MKIVKQLGLLLFILTIGITSCQRNGQTEEDSGQTDSLSADSLVSEPLFTLPFQATYNETTDRFEMIESPDSTNIANNPEGLAKALNNKYPEINVVIDRKNKDTLMVSIPDATALTQTSGTTGATSYLAEATYAFTSLDSIHVVHFNFEEGDHAVPGPYTRNSFKDFTK